MSQSIPVSQQLTLLNPSKSLAAIRAQPLQPAAVMRTTVLCLLVAAAGSGCVGSSSSSTSTPSNPCGDSAATATATATIQRPADAPTEFRIKRCQLDADACLDLCTFVESNNSIVGQILSCTASFEGNTQVTLKISYQNGCALPNGGIGGGGGGGGGVGGGGVVSLDAGTGI